MTTFEDMGLAAPILRALASEEYDTPTPVQAAVIPAMIEGQDVVAVAQTGTGKTAGFTLPLLHKIASDPFEANKKTARVLILAPTRELAAQVETSVKTYAKFMAVSTTLIVGGARLMPQVKSLSFGTDFAVATPGRLEDLMRSGAIKLDGTTAIVLDEADQMMDMGFLPAIRRIMAALPRERQVLLLSATMPKQIRALADEFLRDPVEVALAPQSTPAANIHQTYRTVERMKKRDTLTALLRDGFEGQVIVFTRTKRGADRVTDHLEAEGFAARSLHGDKHQKQRERILSAFRSGRTKILVATDVAARGIDVDDVSLVINYELPINAEAYVHRIGRTGRAGRSGRAIALVDRDERTLLKAIEKLAGRVEREGEDLFAGEAVRPYERKRGKGGRPARSGDGGPTHSRSRRATQSHRKGGDARGRPQRDNRSSYNPIESEFEASESRFNDSNKRKKPSEYKEKRSERRGRDERGGRDEHRGRDERRFGLGDRDRDARGGSSRGPRGEGGRPQSGKPRGRQDGPQGQRRRDDRGGYRGGDRPERRDDHDRGERSRGERTERFGRPDRADRKDRPAQKGRPYRGDRDDHRDRQGRSDRDDRRQRRGSGQDRGYSGRDFDRRDDRREGDYRSDRGGYRSREGGEDRGQRQSSDRPYRPKDGDRPVGRGKPRFADRDAASDRKRGGKGPRRDEAGDRPMRRKSGDRESGRRHADDRGGERKTRAPRTDSHRDGDSRPAARSEKPRSEHSGERPTGPNATRKPQFKKPTRDY